jgi:CubicO group peptidase (beta-lactamase class C family)
VRTDRVLLDATFYPYTGQSPHSVASVTKSLTTLLIGIAIDQGKLHLDDTMVSFFPDTTIANPDERKNDITIRDLASMSSGFDCLYEPNEPTVQAMEASPNWVQFGLDLPMAYKPGTHWEYCGVGMHLLSAILEKATGMTALEYARQNLFEPLGIKDVIWPTDPQGVNRARGIYACSPRIWRKSAIFTSMAGSGMANRSSPVHGWKNRLRSILTRLTGMAMDTAGGPAWITPE